MTYSFARKFGQPSLAPSAFDPFHSHILRGVGAEEETEESGGFSKVALILGIAGGVIAGAYAMHLYMKPSAPAFVAPPPYLATSKRDRQQEQYDLQMQRPEIRQAIHRARARTESESERIARVQRANDLGHAISYEDHQSLMSRGL